MAFEQGRILPTPETVPFRLTRDLVDGMGVAGVEGVYRRCCEKTMELMHNSEEALLTILEVCIIIQSYSKIACLLGYCKCMVFYLISA